MRADEDMCLSKLVDMNLDAYIPKFESVSEAATKEFSLEKAMEKMKKEWEPVSVRRVWHECEISVKWVVKEVASCSPLESNWWDKYAVC